jgi:hypothetical protein
MIRHRWLVSISIACCFLILFFLCFGGALFGGGQFGYRDAGHFYYPLYQRVQTEWEQGRWPLWEPEENAGMPLLGNPTAAVLYPGKLIYALFPYPWAARIYIVAHAALAFAAMFVAMRGWGVSLVGSALAALSYAFGMPVLFQYCNIIYLVGAAWLPLGFLALDRWIRRGSYWGLLGLAVVLAMQTLGGDPQSSYLLGLCGGGYAVGTAWRRGRQQVPDRALGEAGTGSVVERPTRRAWLVIPLVILGLALWIGGTLALAEYFPKVRPAGNPAPALPWMRYVPRAVLAAWAVIGVGFLIRLRSRGRGSRLGLMLLGLGGAALLAAALSAAQLLPVLEFTQQTVRAEGEGPHDIYPFSIEPYRLAELVWPSVLGTNFGRNAYWIDAVRVPGARQKIWVPSLYVGCLALFMAAGAFSLRRGPELRVWLSVILAVSVVGSLGQYTSPIWGARVLAATTGTSIAEIGPLDSNDSTPIRLDGYLRDGDGSIYWWMTTVLPGFRQFRFPAKLFTFSALALAALAGMGWDEIAAGRSRRARTLAAVLLLATLTILALVLWQRQPILASFGTRTTSASFGPIEPDAAFQELVRSLVHGAAVMTAALALLALVRRHALLAGLLVVLAAAADLAIANARYVTTVPQALFEDEPEVLRIIKDAERADPSPGPFRIHRMPLWSPASWLSTPSADRVKEFVAWERGTLQPKYGINLGVEYTHTLGVAELYDLEWFFGGFPFTVRDQTARSLGVKSGDKVVYFPRRSFDMWNSRYFILPEYPNGWLDEFRGYAAFLHETDLIYPPNEWFRGPDRTERLKDWVETSDYQIRRNRQAFPRAWVVHEARGLPPMDGKTRAERSGPIQEMLYAADPIWNDSNMTAFDPHRLVWLDSEDRYALRAFLPGQPPRPGETVQVSYPSPQRVEVDVTLEAPGLVVLADTFYPGWKLTIDGQPAPIYRANRLMRGAAVPAGKSRLVYTYDPPSFRLGCRLSLAGLAVFALLTAGCLVRTRAGKRQAPRKEPEPD